MATKYKTLIFVDNNDNCRAPIAKLILKRKFLTNPMKIKSRGLVVLFPEPIAPKAEEVMAEDGYEAFTHTATQLEQEDIGDDVLILTMEDGQKSKIWENYENAPHVYSLMEYVGEKGDIPDMFGQSVAAYKQFYTEMELLIRKLVIRLNNEEER